MNHESVAHELGLVHTKECDLQDEVVDVKAVNWNRVCQAHLARRSSPKRDARFWDGRALSFAKAVSETDYADHFLAIMKPEPYWTVLDMGCGSGTLAVPLAKLVSSVTAVDFSVEMLNVVHKRCADEGIRNVTTIHGRWEDDWGKLGIESCDVAIASRSMVTDDLQDSILKLDAFARKRAYIVTVVGDGPHDRHLFDAIGRSLISGPDYIYYYNMLYQMGILANVVFIEEKRNRTYNSPDEAVMSMHWMFNELNSHEETKLEAFLKEHLIFQCDSWRLSYDKVIRWAVIWWEKE